MSEKSYAALVPVVGYVAPPVSHVAPAPVDEYFAPAPAVFGAPAPAVEYFSPVGYAAPALVVGYIALAPAMYAAPAPVVDHIAPAPVGDAAPAPVVEHIPQAHAVSRSASSAHQIFYTGGECGALEPDKRDADRIPWSRTSGWSPGGSCPVASQGGCTAWVCVAAAATSSAASFFTSNVSASLWRCWRCLEVRAFWSRRLGGDASGTGNERDENQYEWQEFWRGAGAQVAVRSVLEDHETVILESWCSSARPRSQRFSTNWTMRSTARGWTGSLTL